MRFSAREIPCSMTRLGLSYLAFSRDSFASTKDSKTCSWCSNCFLLPLCLNSTSFLFTRLTAESTDEHWTSANSLLNSDSRDSITEDKLEDKCEKDFEITPSRAWCTSGVIVADGLISSPLSDKVNCLVLIHDREKEYTTVSHFYPRST